MVLKSMKKTNGKGNSVQKSIHMLLCVPGNGHTSVFPHPTVISAVSELPPSTVYAWIQKCWVYASNLIGTPRHVIRNASSAFVAVTNVYLYCIMLFLPRTMKGHTVTRKLHYETCTQRQERCYDQMYTGCAEMIIVQTMLIIRLTRPSNNM